LAQIANDGDRSGPAGNPALDLSDAPLAAIPHDVKPMLATPVAEPFDHPDWVFEVKWDGYRAIAEVERHSVRLYSRRNLSLAERYPPLVDALARLNHDAVLDGEVVVLDAGGKPQFQLLQNYQKARQGVLTYYVFDLLYLDAHDLRSLPLLRRKQLAAQIVKDVPGIKVSEHITATGRAFFQALSRQDLEGMVAKLAQSRYVAGQRTKTWLKLKTHLHQEAVICGFTDERSNPRNLGAVLLGVYEGDDLVYIGHAGTGFDTHTRADIRQRLTPLRQTHCPFKSQPKANARVHWVKPELVCEVSFGSWTHDGHLRHPVFQRLREDIVASTVHREQPEAAHPESTPEEASDPGTAADESRKTSSPRLGSSKSTPAKALSIGGHSVAVTNLNKVYWPAEGYTKGMLIDYYREVSRFLVPHLKDRPQSLHRHPGGILEKSFFQKDMKRQPPPDWVQTVGVASDSEPDITRTLLCQDEATLVYMANLGCIELHPWHARVATLDQPDYLVLDLDPVEIAFAEVAATAQAIRDLLERAEAACYPKTSGKRGLHVYVPFAARYSHEQAKQFAHLVAQIVHRNLPQVTSLERDPRRRHGKVYLDFLQNGKGKTLAAAYAVRPYPGATVSTPLQWTEVSKRLDPSKFTMRTVPPRLARQGDLWAPVLGPGIDLPVCLERLSALLKKG
jgi:bifunctional non-homologous end joining protein LigD